VGLQNPKRRRGKRSLSRLADDPVKRGEKEKDGRGQGKENTGPHHVAAYYHRAGRKGTTEGGKTRTKQKKKNLNRSSGGRRRVRGRYESIKGVAKKLHNNKNGPWFRVESGEIASETSWSRSHGFSKAEGRGGAGEIETKSKC